MGDTVKTQIIYSLTIPIEWFILTAIHVVIEYYLKQSINGI